VLEEWQLEQHHEKLLTLAAESWDRVIEAREIIDSEGLVFLDRFGQPKEHPAAGIERDNRIAFARLLRELDLDAGPEPDVRLPRLPRNR
jgi:hypothetical protein